MSQRKLIIVPSTKYLFAKRCSLFLLFQLWKLPLHVKYLSISFVKTKKSYDVYHRIRAVTLLKSYESKISWVWIFLIFGHMTGRNIIYVLENNNILFSYHTKDESTWKQCWQTDYCACLVYTGLSDGCREKILQLYTIRHNVI